MKKVVILLGLVVVAIPLAFVGFEYYYRDQILPGLTIDNAAFAGENRNLVNDQLAMRVAGYDKQGVHFVQGDNHLDATLADAGYTFDTKGAIDQAMAISHPKIIGMGTWNLLVRLVERQTNVTLPLAVNQATQMQFLNDKIYPTFTVKPTDATLHIANGNVDVVADKDGTWINNDSFIPTLTSTIKSHSLTMAVTATPKKADVLTADLQTAKPEAENLIKRPITLVAGTRKVKPAADDIAQWIFISKEGTQTNVRLDSDKIKAYLDSISGKVDQKTISQQTTPDGTVILAGQDGLSLKVDDSISLIIKALSDVTDTSPTSITLATEVKNRANVVVDPQDGCTAGTTSGKYIEVSLRLQKMCLYDGTTFVQMFRISSGKSSTPTPIGTFSIADKLTNAFSQSAHLWMPLWNGLVGTDASGNDIGSNQYGIHGLPYIGNWIEGQGHIGTPVSHGCVRLSDAGAPYVYDWAPIGTTVIIHQ